MQSEQAYKSLAVYTKDYKRLRLEASVQEKPIVVLLNEIIKDYFSKKIEKETYNQFMNKLSQYSEKESDQS